MARARPALQGSALDQMVEELEERCRDFGPQGASITSQIPAILAITPKSFCCAACGNEAFTGMLECVVCQGKFVYGPRPSSVTGGGPSSTGAPAAGRSDGGGSSPTATPADSAAPAESAEDPWRNRQLTQVIASKWRTDKKTCRNVVLHQDKWDDDEAYRLRSATMGWVRELPQKLTEPWVPANRDAMPPVKAQFGPQQYAKIAAGDLYRENLVKDQKMSEEVKSQIDKILTDGLPP